MAKNHGAKQQKKVAKQKAKRSAKRAFLQRRNSSDPTIRLQRAGDWPVVQALAGAELWDDGIGHMILARQQAEGRIVIALFLVDVHCLGVKNAFWREGSREDLREIIEKMEDTQTMRPIAPACLVKIIRGAVEFAQSFGFAPHRDYRHASMLLDGIDPSTCPDEFIFGRDGKPLYIQGPYESPAQAEAILQRVNDAGGHFVMGLNGPPEGRLLSLEGQFDDLEEEDDDSADES